MARNTVSNAAIIEQRRSVVAGLRLRNASIRQIVETLPRMGIVNPRTGKAYAIGTIHSDLEAVEAAWRDESVAAIDTLRGRQLAEIREARTEAWKAKDLTQVARLIKLEMDLLGTAAPSRSHVAIEDLHSLSDAELQQIVSGGG